MNRLNPSAQGTLIIYMITQQQSVIASKKIAFQIGSQLIIESACSEN
jgi:hypothetical protein